MPSPARDLYQSTLFRGRLAYAEAAGKPWFIMSALYGLVDPDEVVAPYDVSMRQLDRVQRTTLGEDVVEALERRVGSLAGSMVEPSRWQRVRGGDRRVAALSEGDARSAAAGTWIGKAVAVVQAMVHRQIAALEIAG